MKYGTEYGGTVHLPLSICPVAYGFRVWVAQTKEKTLHAAGLECFLGTLDVREEAFLILQYVNAWTSALVVLSKINKFLVNRIIHVLSIIMD